MNRFRRIAGSRAELLLAAASALIAAVLVAIGFSLAWPLKLDVGAGDARFVSGFHAPEQFGNALVRWTTADATIALPRPPLGADMLVELRLLAARPAGQPDAHVALRVDDLPI